MQRARTEGWRSRAVFKLEQIDQREKLLRPGQICLDLALRPGPGARCEATVGARGRVVGSDILPLEPLGQRGARQGDFREEAVLRSLLEQLPEHGVDVVLSDMAPNMSGIDAVDQPRSMYLAELALDLAGQLLKPQGSALIKVFQGVGFTELVAGARNKFAKTKLVKPEASRARSASCTCWRSTSLWCRFIQQGIEFT